MKTLVIAISGTPGTGKSAAAKLLKRKLKGCLITVPSLIRKKHIRYGYDRKRKTKIIDEREFAKAVKKNIIKEKANIVESHLAHFAKADFVFVLRSNPAVLEKRLKKRKWPAAKIKENVEAELLDETTSEALSINKNVYEIDTSRSSADRTAALIEKILNNYHYGKKYRAGKISWMEKYGKQLFRKKLHQK